MASATVLRPPRRADGGGEEQLRVGKRPRQAAAMTSPSLVMRRRPLDEHKWALLEREQELERRRMAEAIRRLEAIEELRRKTRERKLDRDKRRIEFAAKLEHSVLMLQRCERGRQARKTARARAHAAGTIVKWVLAKIRHAAMLKAVRNRTILRIMVSVEHLVEERLSEAIFFVKNVIAVRAFRTHRAARVIQGALRRRAELVRKCAVTIVGAVRCWLARGALRRARIRRGIRRYRGSLSRRNLGLKDPGSLSLAAIKEFTREGRWWDSGVPAAPPRPRWGIQRVENEEARSRQRALSLADLIKSGQQQQEHESSAAASRSGSGGGCGGDGGAGKWRLSVVQDPATPAEAVPSWKAKRWGKSGRTDVRNSTVGNGAKSPSGGGRSRQAAPMPIGFGKVASSKRAVSMIDPREAEKAALLHDLERRLARKKEAPPDYHKLSIVEKHMHREREFHEQREKRRAAAEREARRKEKQRAREVAEAARQKALQAELLAKKQQEKASRRFQKIKEYKEKKAAKELAEKKALAAQREDERRAKAADEARRRAIEAAFEKERAERLERARRKRRAEEKHARRKDGVGRGTEAGHKLSGASHPTHHRAKKHAAVNNSRTALAPIAVANNVSNYSIDWDDGRKRRRRGVRRGSGGNSNTDGVAAGTTIGGSNSCPTFPGIVRRSVKVAAGMRDGRRKAAPHGATVPSLPVVPGWKAMATGGTGRVVKRKRVRRRPPKGGVTVEGDRGWGRQREGGLADPGGTTSTGDEIDRSLEPSNSAADLDRLLMRTSGQDGDKKVATSREINVDRNRSDSANQQTAREGRGGVPQGQHQTRGEAAEEDDVGGSDRERSSPLAEGESLSMETLDSAFPIPGDGYDSGGGEGLGETSSQERLGLLSPGWSSRSSRRSSEAGETSSGFLSDSAAIREGQALLSGEVSMRASGYAQSVDDGAQVSTAAGSTVEESGPGRLEIPLSGKVEARYTVPGSLPIAGDERAVSHGAVVQLPSSAAFPDSISDMSDNRTFIGQDQQHQQQDEEEYGEEKGGLDVHSPSSFLGQRSNEEDATEVMLGAGAEATDFLDGGRLHTADQDCIGHGGGVVSDQILTSNP